MRMRVTLRVVTKVIKRGGRAINMFRLQSLWLSCILSSSVLLTVSFGEHERENSCLDGCYCYSWEAPIDRHGKISDRFTVNCTGMKYGLFQGTSIPHNLPSNTTDLVVSEYLLGSLNLASFPNTLDPMLLSLTLYNCHIDFLSSETFHSNNFFVAIKNISITRNIIEILLEGTFMNLPFVENISMAGNLMERVQSGTFRKLPQALTIDLSDNMLSEIKPGAFDDLPVLEVLDLSRNWLTTIPGSDILQLPSLRVLNLGGNFWNCSCDMAWVLELNHSVLLQSQGVCLYPSILNGTPFHNLTFENFNFCFGEYSINRTHSIVAFFTTVVLGITLYLMFRPSTRKVGDIVFDVNNLLGQNVFKGKLIKDNRKIAVKRVKKLTKASCKELDILLRIADKGPVNNIIQYIWYEHDSMYTYIALELCGGDLRSAVTNQHAKVFPYLTPGHCLSQLVHGLCYIHQLNIQHRDIKPQNILWRISEANPSCVRFILSDFDLGQCNDEVSSHKSHYGTEGWAAPELWCSTTERRTLKVDIFSLGCVFYYVLTMGRHPFGPILDPGVCQDNIIDCHFAASLSDLGASCFGNCSQNLIAGMIHYESQKRPEAAVLLNHPLFWDQEAMMNFYLKIGDYMDGKGVELDHLKSMLQLNSAEVFEGSWMERLPEKPVRSDIVSFKKQSGNICFLLRVVRNKIVHFHTLGEKLKEIYNKSPEGVMDYYNQHFPFLLIYTFKVGREWKENMES